METILKVGEIQKEQAELVVLGLLEDQVVLGKAAAEMDQALGGQITRILSDGDFKGKAKELTLLYSAAGAAAKRVLLVGLGKESKLNSESIRIAAGVSAKRVLDLGVKKFAMEVFGADQEKVNLADAVQAVVEGAGLALYEFTPLKSETDDKKKKIEEITLVIPDHFDLKDAEAGLAAGKAIVAGTSLTRDLVNWPGNYATPTFLAQQAQKLAETTGLTCQVLDEAAYGWNWGWAACLVFLRGAISQPSLSCWSIMPNNNDLDTIVLVGKGVTFDSGGISIKPADDMERMRSDMAGGAAVMGAMLAVSSMELPLHVVALVPATENMPSGKALKPGDILRMMNGKTVEVINTDAEGRLILADALSYAARYKPKAVVDIATLTGARTVALGDQAIGLFSNDDDLAQRFVTAGQKPGNGSGGCPSLRNMRTT